MFYKTLLLKKSIILLKIRFYLGQNLKLVDFVSNIYRFSYYILGTTIKSYYFLKVLVLGVYFFVYSSLSRIKGI